MKTQLHAELAQVKRSLAITQLLGAPGILLIGLALWHRILFSFSGSEIHPCRCCLCSLVGTRRRHNYSHCAVASWAKA
uniref:Uncharacterized protein n=1 Tax=Escherichia coli TaxID=562 RepID=A0A6D1P748_ECOLX|nr:hypothetical protein pSAL-19-0623_NDM_00266 [Salmonella enterica subsp. enterica serovar London]QIC03664.1 hypothetical protein pJ53_SAL-19-0623_NDM_00016 [Escherichia coli]